MAALIKRAQRFYARALRPGEQVVRSNLGYAPRTGTLVAAGAVLGGVIGWLYAIYLEAAPLPAVFLGLLAGIIGGYGYAESQARRPEGPGATTFTVLITTERLAIISRYGWIRPRVLRSYDLDALEDAVARRLPLGNYHRTSLQTASDRNITIITAGALRIDP